jgi:hypothetical protein
MRLFEDNRIIKISKCSCEKYEEVFESVYTDKCIVLVLVQCFTETTQDIIFSKNEK